MTCNTNTLAKAVREPNLNHGPTSIKLIKVTAAGERWKHCVFVMFLQNYEDEEEGVSTSKATSCGAMLHVVGSVTAARFSLLKASVMSHVVLAA